MLKTKLMLTAALLALAGGAVVVADSPDFGSMPAPWLGADAGKGTGDIPAPWLGKDAGKVDCDGDVACHLTGKPPGFIQDALKQSWDFINPIGTAHAEYNATTGNTATMRSAPKTYGGLSNRRPYVAGGYSYPERTFGYYWGKFFASLRSDWNRPSPWAEESVGNIPGTFLAEVKVGVGDIKAGWLGTNIVGTAPGWVGSQFSNVTSDSGWHGPGFGN